MSETGSADLHLHTLASDGLIGARDLVEHVASHTDLDVIAVTDHDETSAAIVEETGDAERPWSIRSNIVASQTAIHRDWGGVVPELASRQHVRDICGVVERGLRDSATGWDDVGLIAVVGEGMRGTAGLAGRIFTAISRQQINIIAIAQGSSELTIVIVVHRAGLERAVQAIHEECGLGV